MNRIKLLIFVASLVTSLFIVFGDTMTRMGVLMDAACGARVAANAEKTAAHTVACALMDSCRASGYGLILKGQFLKFDQPGDTQALKLLKASRTRDNVTVKVTGTFSETNIKVLRIRVAKTAH